MLMKQHAKSEWVSLLVWSLILGAFVFFTVLLWNFALTQGMMADLESIMRNIPAALRGALGFESFATLNNWLQFYSVNFAGFMALPILAYVALFAASMVTREMDRRTMEFLLSLPVSRWQVIVSRWGNLAIALAVLHVAHFVALVLGVLSVGEEPAIGRYLLVELNAALLYLAIGSVMLVVSLLTDDYGRGLVFTFLIGYGLYFLHAGTDGAQGLLGKLHAALPFGLFNAQAILGQGDFPTSDLIGLVLYAVGGLAVSGWLFQRKQIAV